jgi:hypothetical protein
MNALWRAQARSERVATNNSNRTGEKGARHRFCQTRQQELFLLLPLPPKAASALRSAAALHKAFMHMRCFGLERLAGALVGMPRFA